MKLPCVRRKTCYTHAAMKTGQVITATASIRIHLWLAATAFLFSLLPRHSIALLLRYSYPESDPNDPSLTDYNIIELSCGEVFGGVANDAVFFVYRGGSRAEEAEEIRGEATAVPGVIRYTISPETEGEFWCRSGTTESNAVPLAAKPSNNFNCASNSEDTVDYQLLPYSSNDLYSFNCTVQPGAMRRSYRFESWRFRSGITLFPHNTWDRSTYALTLGSQNFFGLFKEKKRLECRVDIAHSPDDTGTYCGQSIRAAVKSNIIQPLPQTMEVTPNHHQLNLVCTAVGSALKFTWSYDNNVYTIDDNPCHHDSNDEDDDDEPCVKVRQSLLDPVRATSVLKIGRERLMPGSRTEVTCQVTQNLDQKFGSQPLRSHGIITVATIVGGTNDDETDSPPKDDVEPTTFTLTSNHIYLIILLVPITIVTVVVIVLVCVCRKRRRGSFSDDGGQEEDYERLPSSSSGYDQTDSSNLSFSPPLSSLQHTTNTNWSLAHYRPTSLARHFVQNILLPGGNSNNGHSNGGLLHCFMVTFLQSTTHPRQPAFRKGMVFPGKIVNCSNGKCSDGDKKKLVYEVILLEDTGTQSQTKVCSVPALPSAPVDFKATNPLELMPDNATEDHCATLETNVDCFTGTTRDQLHPVKTSVDDDYANTELLETTLNQNEPLKTTGTNCCETYETELNQST